MAIGVNCEVCGAPPPIFTSGEWAGQRGTHTYCDLCSKDLCDDCLKNGRCKEASDGKHIPYGDDEDE
jgi:hypothetical protein